MWLQPGGQVLMGSLWGGASGQSVRKVVPLCRSLAAPLPHGGSPAWTAGGPATSTGQGLLGALSLKLTRLSVVGALCRVVPGFPRELQTRPVPAPHPSTPRTRTQQRGRFWESPWEGQVCMKGPAIAGAWKGIRDMGCSLPAQGLRRGSPGARPPWPAPLSPRPSSLPTQPPESSHLGTGPRKTHALPGPLGPGCS